MREKKVKFKEIHGTSGQQAVLQLTAYVRDVAQYGLAPNVKTLTLHNIILAAGEEQTAKVC